VDAEAFGNRDLLIVVDPLSHTTSLRTMAEKLASVTDALGKVGSQFADSAGRPVAVTDPLDGPARRCTIRSIGPPRVSDSLAGTIGRSFDRQPAVRDRSTEPCDRLHAGPPDVGDVPERRRDELRL